MKILVLSDSHSSLHFMRRCITVVRPDAVVHLGDFYDDGKVIAEENPGLIFHQLPGNCDRFRCPPWQQEVLVYPVCGVKLYMTHGHKHMVKNGIGGLLRDARRCGAQAALYGHTHIPDCHQEPDGMWVLNPGSSGYGSTAGLIITDGETITACRILGQAELEEMK